MAREALAIVALLTLALLPPAALAAPLPEGCSERGPRAWGCAWRIAVPPLSDLASRDLPPSGPAVVTITIEASPLVRGWWWEILDKQSGTTISGASTRPSDPLDSAVNHVALLPLDGTRQYAFVIHAVSPSLAPQEFEVVLEAQRAEGTGRAASPAATREDPHLRDAEGDSPRPETDLLAVWFDQPFLDDGLATLSIALVALPTAWTSPAVSGQAHTNPAYRYRVEWTVLGQRYHVRIWMGANCADEGCTAPAWEAIMGTPQQYRVELPLTLDAANATLTVAFPLRGAGSPGPQDWFTNVTADAVAYPPTAASTLIATSPEGGNADCSMGNPLCSLDDHSDAPETRPFAVGGPEVWERLRNRGTLAPATLGPAPWYREPLAADNLADTLQVAGAAAAGVTFLAGLFLVRRRRERLARLLDDVDAVLEVHAGDHAAALRALSALEGRFDRMLREGTIAEGQHAVLLARIERAGYRLMQAAKREGEA